MTHEEMIAVIQAHKEGRTIESFHEIYTSGEWRESPDPAWDFATYKYRIKQEPKYRPFENAEEAMAAIKEHGDWLKWNENGNYYVICIVSDTCVVPYQDEGYDYDEAFKEFTFADGTPFGVKED